MTRYEAAPAAGGSLVSGSTLGVVQIDCDVLLVKMGLTVAVNILQYSTRWRDLPCEPQGSTSLRAASAHTLFTRIIPSYQFRTQVTSCGTLK
jgi:hypothetical protein